MTTMVSKKKWYVSLSIIACGCALASFLYSYFYPELVDDRRGNPLAKPFIWLFFLFTFSAPFVLGSTLLQPRAATIMVAKIHAATYFSFLLMISISSGSPGYSSLEASFSGAIEVFLYAILAFELVIIGIAILRRYKKGDNESEIPWTFTTVTIALFGGWSCGVLLWSFSYPLRVVEEAELAAAGRPYCMMSNYLQDLTAINMYVPDHEGWTFSFHQLLIIEEGDGLTYMNWSYRRGGFNRIGERTRKSMYLDKYHCKAIPHFALNLPTMR